MRVRIDNASEGEWYKKQIGSILNVSNDSADSGYYIVDGSAGQYFILKQDCTVLEEEQESKSAKKLFSKLSDSGHDLLKETRTCSQCNGIGKVAVARKVESTIINELKGFPTLAEIQTADEEYNAKHATPEQPPRLPFDLEKAKTHQVVTRYGMKVRILATDVQHEKYTIAGLITGANGEFTETWQSSGRVGSMGEAGNDLFLVPKQISKWVAILHSREQDDEYGAIAEGKSLGRSMNSITFVGTKEIKVNE